MYIKCFGIKRKPYSPATLKTISESMAAIVRDRKTSMQIAGAQNSVTVRGVPPPVTVFDESTVGQGNKRPRGE